MDFGMLAEMVRSALAPTWHPARIDCLMGMLRGLLLAQTVSTYRLAQRMVGDAQFESHAQRIRRLLAEQAFDWSVIGRLLLRLAGVHAKSRLIVAVDRTNWDFGRTAVNFLVIGIVVRGVGIPIVWTQLGKKGNSRTSERLDLLERFPQPVPAHQVKVLLADREFIGKGWFIAPRERKIPCAIRVRDNQFVCTCDGSRNRISTLAKNLARQRPRAWAEAWLDGVPCSLSLKRLPDGEILAVVAHGLRRGDDPLGVYRLRWGIELCFACLKGKGFNIEDTHPRHAERLEKIFALASIAAAATLRAATGQPNEPARRASSRKKTTAMPLVPLSSVA